MKVLHVFIKAFKEQIRDYMVLSLSLALAPAFVFVYWLFFPGGGSTAYDILIINRDLPVLSEDGTAVNASADLIESFIAVTYSDGQPILNTEIVTDQKDALLAVKNRKAELLVIIPETFSHSVLDFHNEELSESSLVEFHGDLTNPYYAVAAVMASAGLEAWTADQTNAVRPAEIAEFPIGDSAGRSEFELYVPGMLMFSVVLLVFQASMIISYEVESGTFQRLRMSGVTAFEYLAGVSLSVLLIGITAVLLAFGTAVLLGFESQGPLWAAVLVGTITCVSVIGIGLMISAFTKTVSQAFIAANFPLVILMFFTGIIYPIQGVHLFTVFGHDVEFFDVLPPTHAVKALNKILSLGSGLEEVWFELTALTLLSIFYFAAGVLLFKKKQMKEW